MREASSRVPRRERLHVVKRVLAVGRGVVRHSSVRAVSTNVRLDILVASGDIETDHRESPSK
jgi:hypothetical protein